MNRLTQTQQEILTEILNIGIGSAASALSDMAGEEVVLSTPVVDFAAADEVVARLDDTVGNTVSAVRQEFGGAFPGRALLLFPEHKSLELVRILLEDTVPLEAMTEMEQEAMCEVGNVLLNATLSSVADVLDTEIETEIPESVHCTSQELMAAGGDDPARQVMFLRVNFSLRKTSVEGYVAFLLGVTSIRELGRRLDVHLEELTMAYA